MPSLTSRFNFRYVRICAIDRAQSGSLLLHTLLLAITLLLLTYLSWRSIILPASHGFYRYFAFILITLLSFCNAKYWLVQPYSNSQLLSWLLLFSSAGLVISSVYLMNQYGGKRSSNKLKANFEFENTQTLVTRGIFSYIRHPMYSSLMLLALGILLKDINTLTIILCLASIIFLYTAASVEEKENLAFFGDDYATYMKTSKRFIPFSF